MQDRNHDTKSRSNIEKQSTELIDSDSDVVELVAIIDFTQYQSKGDTYDEWHASYPFEAMVSALYLKDLMGYSDTDLHRRLSENPEEAHGGSKIYAENAPKGIDVPGGETLLHYIIQLDSADIHDILDEAIEVQLKRAKRHLEFTRPVEIAIDMTYVVYYGEHGPEANYGLDNQNVVVMGAPPSIGFDCCYKFATASIAGDNVRFTLAVRPHTKEQSIGELVREIHWAAAEHVSIQTVYANAEFYSAEVIQTPVEPGSNYAIRVPANDRVNSQIARANHDV